ncbi:MAG TPA: hypothetical protein ENI95_11460 [Chloroflexi bacterium]|nr:hypothetical protein [Chloroflexota bacterium]
MSETGEDLRREFEPNGREPQLTGSRNDNVPMLGGVRRLWPSLAAHLLSEQHRAHRAGQMERVWVIRRLRARIQILMIREREESLLAGRPFRPVTDSEALAELIAERDEVLEELEQARRWLRPLRAAEHSRALGIIEEYIAFWESRLA